MNNELHPTVEEMNQDYLKKFWIQPSYKVYTNPPVVEVETRQDTMQKIVHTTIIQDSTTQFIYDKVHLHQLET